MNAMKEEETLMSLLVGGFYLIGIFGEGFPAT